MNTVVPRRRPPLALVAVVAILALLILVSGVVLLKLRSEAIERGEAFAAMHARTMENYLSQSLDTVLVTAAALKPAADGGVPGDEALRAMPLVRSLSFLDQDARIAASTNPRNVGLRVPLTGFYPPGAPAGLATIGVPWSGRDFVNGHPAAVGDGIAGGDLGFVPVLLDDRDAGGHRILLALNSDAVRLQFSQSLAAEDGVIEAVRYDRTLLLASRPDERPGSIVADLSATPSDGVVETAGGAISHAQASPRHPFLVVARLDRDHVLDAWRRTAFIVAATLGVVTVIFGTAGWVMLRRRRQFEAQRDALEQLQRVNAACVFDNAREGIAIVDAVGRITDVNDSFCRLTGLRRGDVLGRAALGLAILAEAAPTRRALLGALGRDGYWGGEVALTRPDGVTAVVLATVSTVRDVAGRRRQHVVLFSDITLAKRQEQALERAAHYDALTGLPNRTLIRRHIETAMAAARDGAEPVAIAFIDVDGFKEVNDTLGHAAGDDLLRQIAARLTTALGPGDVLGRLGGDEFIAVLHGVGEAPQRQTRLRRLLDAARVPVSLADHVVHLSASIGVAFCSADEMLDADQLLRQADQAMYEAKIGGKSRYQVFDRAVAQSARAYHEGLDGLRAAFDARQFVLHFQPVVDMVGGRVHAMEALIRWQHPTLGLVPPSGFLPLIEGNAFAVGVGDWVIDEALRHLATWRAGGLDLTVAVNVSGVQLHDKAFTRRLGDLARDHHEIAAGRLEIELPESVIFADIGSISDVIHAGQALGIRFLLDDFGTGYSSLAYLKRLPIDGLKIDRAFVRDMLDGARSMAILKAILRLAGELGFETVAEGVETRAQWDALAGLACERVQGFHIARPMPGDAVADWCRNWETRHASLTTTRFCC
jgi:diguanylate cyclase (GGDEF)-like protein/PAS domain S-box-containing protein